MKTIKCIPILILILFTNAIMLAQKRGIEFNNLKKNTVDFISENKRVKIKTTDGKSLIGKFTIIDSATIKIENKPINIDAIVMIRSNPMGATVTSKILVIVGTTLISAENLFDMTTPNDFIQITDGRFDIGPGLRTKIFP
jgi:hypothetical protein